MGVALGQTSLSFAGHRRGMADDERRVYAVLQAHRGEGSAISRKDLAAQTGLADRDVRSAVHELVAEHHLPVLAADRGGYYLAESSDEIEAAARNLMSYIQRLSQRAAALRYIARQAAQGRLL